MCFVEVYFKSSGGLQWADNKLKFYVSKFSWIYRYVDAKLIREFSTIKVETC